MLYFKESYVVNLFTIALFQHFCHNMKHWMNIEQRNDCNSQNLAQSSARLWVQGSVPALVLCPLLAHTQCSVDEGIFVLRVAHTSGLSRGPSQNCRRARSRHKGRARHTPTRGAPCPARCRHSPLGRPVPQQAETTTPHLGRARLELGTTRLCSTTAEHLRDLLEVG